MLSNQGNISCQSNVQYMYNISFITFILSWEPVSYYVNKSVFYVILFTYFSSISRFTFVPVDFRFTDEDYAYFVVGPAFIDFNDVCMRSINTKHINIVNNLESHIHVQVTVSYIITIIYNTL